MSGKIVITDDVPELIANVVPFLINHNGDANTHTYFTPTKRSVDATGETEAQFRGLRLVGVESHLGNKAGYICDSSEFLQLDPSGNGDAVPCKQFVATHKFNKLIAFGHGAPPAHCSKHLLLQELDEISAAVHG